MSRQAVNGEMDEQQQEMDLDSDNIAEAKWLVIPKGHYLSCSERILVYPGCNDILNWGTVLRWGNATSPKIQLLNLTLEHENFNRQTRPSLIHE